MENFRFLVNIASETKIYQLLLLFWSLTRGHIQTYFVRLKWENYRNFPQMCFDSKSNGLFLDS